jgi:hypothetical protein
MSDSAIAKFVRVMSDARVSDREVAKRDNQVAAQLERLRDQVKTLKNEWVMPLADITDAGQSDTELAQAAKQAKANELKPQIDELYQEIDGLNTAYSEAQNRGDNVTKAAALEEVKLAVQRKRFDVELKRLGVGPDMLKAALDEIGDIHLQIADDHLQRAAATRFVALWKRRDAMISDDDTTLETRIAAAPSLVSDIAAAKATFEGYVAFGKSKAEREVMSAALGKYVDEGNRRKIVNLATNAKTVKTNLELVERRKAVTDPSGANKDIITIDKQYKGLKRIYEDQILLPKLSPKLEQALIDNPNGPEKEMQDALGEDEFINTMLDVYNIAEAVGAPEIGKLSIGEAVAIYNYTGNKYAEMNGAKLGYLPAKTPEDADKLEIMSEQAVKALAKLDAVPVTSKRGEARWPDDEATYVEGQNFTVKAFWSTGVGFSFPGEWQITVTGKTGKNVAAMSKHPNEAEVLFPPGTTFKVNKLNKNNPKRMLVEVEEV